MSRALCSAKDARKVVNSFFFFFIFFFSSPYHAMALRKVIIVIFWLGSHFIWRLGKFYWHWEAYYIMGNISQFKESSTYLIGW